MSKRYMTSSEVDDCYFTVLAALDKENKTVLAHELELERAFGVPFDRCPICNGRRQNPALGKACAYCGAVIKCGT